MRILIGLVVVLCVSSATAQTLVGDRVRLNTGPCVLMSGSGTPEGVVTATCGMYIDTATDVWYTKWTGTGNTGWGVGHNANAQINGTLGVSGNTSLSGFVGHPSYVSQLTNWRITAAGEGDFRYLYTDELHAKLFIADLEQALAGGQIICKSVALLGSNFTNPAPSGGASMVVRDLPSAENVAAFQDGDWVGLRAFTRTAGSLTIAETFGMVSSYADQAGGTQAWWFTRGTGANGGGMATSTVVATDAIVIDYGVSDNGCHEVNAIDGLNGVNSPYSQTWRWTTSPIPANRLVGTRLGNLRGITAGTIDYGLYAGNGAPGDINAPLLVFSTQIGGLIRNVDLNMYSSGVNTIRLNPSGPAFSIGSPLPTAYATGTGIWMGNDGGTYKFRVGNPAGNRMTWDGTTLAVAGEGSGVTNISGANIQTGTVSAAKLTVGSGINLIRNSDCAVGPEDWTTFTNTGLTITLGWGPTVGATFSLNSGNNTCYFQTLGTPSAGQATQVYVTTPIPAQQAVKYEASAYMIGHVGGDTVVQLQFSDAAAAVLATSSGNVCTDTSADGRYLQNYCRSAVLATAPSLTSTMRLLITTTLEAVLNQSLFYVHTYLGEALINQTEFTPWGAGGVTEITGGLIRTGSIVAGNIAANTITATQIAAATITATQIAADAITSAKIAAGTIVAADIAAGTITATELAANSVTASKINVSNLSSINSSLGTITGGSLNIGSGNFTVSSGGIVFAEELDTQDFVALGDANFVNAIIVGGTSHVGLVRSSDLDGSGTVHVCANNSGDLIICP